MTPDDNPNTPVSRHGRTESGPSRRGWLLGGIALLAVIGVAAWVILGHFGSPSAPVAATATTSAAVSAAAMSPQLPAAPATGSPDAPIPPGAVPPGDFTQLKNDFTQLQAKLPGTVGIAISAVGVAQPQLVLGDWPGGSAWSTSKVPLVIAAMQAANATTPTDAMIAAITESDNAAAESIWEGLGDPVTAAQKVQDVLNHNGDPTTHVESRKLRQEYTAFGQTQWSLTDQLRFISTAMCDKANDPVFKLMGQVEAGQSWGIGQIPGNPQFKGGWGPSESGAYLVRQMGVFPGANGGRVAVTMAAEPESGTFADGTNYLTQMANFLNDHMPVLPEGQCAP